MEYVWIGILAIAYFVVWFKTLEHFSWNSPYWTPFEVGDWKNVSFYDVWLWLNEVAVIVLFIFSLIKFIQKWS